MRSRYSAYAALAVALLTGCGGGGTEPTPGTADPAGLWDVSLTDMSEPIGGYATACETGFTMSVDPGEATDVYQVVVPYNVVLRCAGGQTLPWIFAASFLIIHRSADSLYFMRPQGDTVVTAIFSPVTMLGRFTAPFRPVARFSASRHKGSTDPNLAPTSIAAGVYYGGTLDVGDSVRADARVENAYGQPLTPAIKWTSSDPTIATISDAGMIHGLRPGPVSITGAVDTLSSSAPVLVLAPPASVTITQVPDSLIVPTTAMLVGVARDADGRVLPERRFHWTSSDTTIATVDEYGIETVVTPHAAGTVTITARSTLSSATVTIRVLAATSSVKLSGSGYGPKEVAGQP